MSCCQTTCSQGDCCQMLKREWIFTFRMKRGVTMEIHVEADPDRGGLAYAEARAAAYIARKWDTDIATAAERTLAAMPQATAVECRDELGHGARVSR